MEELGEITQLLLRFSPDALLVVDEGGRICFANETLTQLFGHAVASLVGERMDVLLPERLRAQHEQHFAGYGLNPIAREMGVRITDLFGRRADGSEFPAGIRLAPFRVGKRLYVAAAIRDMTERRLFSEALVAAREEADRANRAKSRFLATASHDLRQPLQTIRLLNSAMQKIHRPDLEEMLEHQSQAIDSMIRLLNSLLDISRLESGAITPELQPVELAPLLQELQSEFGPLTHTRNLELRVKSARAVIRTDRNLLLQLLQNLLGNAIKYTDEGYIAINCVLDKDALTVSVEDTGIGIPADKLERIFDEYYQVNTRGTKRMGVGLGLAIVREVAQLLKFTIEIKARPGGGTRAAVRIPRHSLTTLSPVRQVALLVPVPPQSHLRILLVEDNDAVRVATELFLKFEGYEVISAGSAAEADAVFGGIRSGDVLITDYHLDADNTGLELLVGLRSRLGYDIPGIVLTGDLPMVLRRSGAQALPACRFLPKPVDTQALVDAISELGAQDHESHPGAAVQLAT